MPTQFGERRIFYLCKCGTPCKSWDGNILRKNIKGCNGCANWVYNPEKQKEVQQKFFEETGYINKFQLESVKEKS